MCIARRLILLKALCQTLLFVHTDGMGDPNDISLRELSNKLVRRSITEVLFKDGYLVMTLDNGTSVKVRGNSREDDSVAIVVDVPERRSVE